MLHLFRRYFSIHKAVFILREAVLIYFALTPASFALMKEEITFSFLLEMAWWKALLVTVVAQFGLLMKALLLQKWFHVPSDPDVENQINDRILLNKFKHPLFFLEPKCTRL